jgi:hypothetical protein
MTEPMPRPAATLAPFDLIVPAQLLVPGAPHDGRRVSEREVRFGAGEDAAVLTVTTWGRCRPGCRGGGARSTHEAGSDVRLKVPCENMPHCHSCECGDSHDFVLLPEHVAKLKGILP